MSDCVVKMVLSASQIPVSLFRQILVVPFAIRARREGKDVNSGEELVDRLCHILDTKQSPRLWHAIDDPLRHLPEDQSAAGVGLLDAYQEFVYFEPFVQRFLYARPANNGGRSPVRLYQRRDVAALDFAVPDRSDPESWPRYRLRVERVSLHLFDTGNALFAVEFAFDVALAQRANEADPAPRYRDAVTLADVLSIVESVRRIYPPFFEEKDGGLRTRFPAGLTWLTDPEASTAFDATAGHEATAYIEHVFNRRCSPMHQAWRELLRLAGGAGLPLEGYDCDSAVMLAQTGDDRAASFVSLAVPDPFAISRPDWVRLCFADTPGSADDYSYGEDFLARFEAEHCYDRFWEPAKFEKTEIGEGNSRPPSTWKNTRYLVCGYQLTAVGKWDGTPKNENTFNYFRDVVQEHLRRHYFQLFLISQFHKVALLTLSDRLSQALARQPEEAFADAVRVIQKDILRFTNRYWFEEISAQLQGQELFRLMRGHLRNREMYDQLSREVSETTAYGDNQEQRRVALGTERLNKIAYPGLIAAAVTGFFGMNFFEADTLRDQPLLWLLLTAALAVLVFLGVHTWFDRLQGWLRHPPGRRVWWGALAVLGVSAFLLLI